MGGQPYQEAQLPRGPGHWECVPGVGSCRGARLPGAPQGWPRMWGSRPLRGPHRPAEWGSSGSRGVLGQAPLLAGPRSSSPAPRPAPWSGRQVGRTLYAGLPPWPPAWLVPRGPRGGHLAILWQLRGLLRRGGGAEERKPGEERRGVRDLPCHGPAPGAQRGRTAATQAMCVHIQFITFIENRKPHT